MRRWLSIAAILISFGTASAHAQWSIGDPKYINQDPDPAQIQRGQQEAAKRAANVKALFYLFEGAAKILLFLSFWYVSTEVIELERWRKIQDVGARVLGVVAGVIIFILIARGGLQMSRETQAKMAAGMEQPTSGLPSGWAPPPRDNPIQRAVSDVVGFGFTLLPLGVMSFAGYVVGTVGGIACYFATKAVLGGWKDFPRRPWRLTIGASSFMAGAVLDLVVWCFKPA
jgi:hypothetical protein